MNVAAEDVMEFQAEVGHVKPDGESLTMPEVQSLYHTFVEEEFKEFMEATEDAHKLQEAMDLVWVVLGYCNTRGWDVEGAWDELYRSNMSKLQIDEVTGELKRRADGKILKPEGWQKPDFTPFVNGGQ